MMEHMTYPTIQSALQWISDVWLALLAIVVIAIVIEFLGERFIKIVVRRVVHGHYIGRPKQPLADVIKRQDTVISISVVVWKTTVFLGAVVATILTLFPNVNFVPLFASAGIIGAALGFGAQSLIKDMLAGVFIITENQFRVGDVIEIEGTGVSGKGKVEHISLRSTAFRDISGNVHYVSNGTILHIINKTMGYSKVNFSIHVKASTDVDKLASLVNRVGIELAEAEIWKKKVTEPPHFYNIGDIGEDTFEVVIVGKTLAGEQWTVTSEYKKRLLGELKKHKTIQLA